MAYGARTSAEKYGLKVVYDKSYPPTATDFTPIMRAVQATNPDIVFVGSYPPDSVGILKAANEIRLKTKMSEVAWSDYSSPDSRRASARY